MSKKAKVAGSVVAGFPSPAEQYLEPPLDLNELLVKRPAATYFVRVEGDSMIEAGIHDGDLLVVDRTLRPASGDVIIASVDGDFTVKTLRLGNRDEERGNRKKGIGNREEGIGKRDEETDIRLEPANPKYPTIILEPGQKLDYFGKVTACIHRF
jgi:DNA polymerase V